MRSAGDVPDPGRTLMMITERSKRVIPIGPDEAKKVGEGCFYLDLIVWLNGDRIELGDGVGFNYGCYVNGYGGLRIGRRTIVGPYVMIHTANHEIAQGQMIAEQGWAGRAVEIGADCWIGMGVCILPGAHLGDGCVVGAGSVVTGELDPGSIAVGNPARTIRRR
jgi:acetyltransferase-like isoleucine patch superfamily enzyme